MSAVTTVLRVGLRLNHDGGVFTVVELAGLRLLLRRFDELSDRRATTSATWAAP